LNVAGPLTDAELRATNIPVVPFAKGLSVAQVNTTNTADTDIIAAPGAGKRLWVFGVMVKTDTGLGQAVTLKHGTITRQVITVTGALLWTPATMATALGEPLPVNTAFVARNAATAGTVVAWYQILDA
jgi:hypothetical protein